MLTSSQPDLAVPSAVTATPARRRLQPWHWAPYAFLSPFLILFAVFGVFPLLFSLVLSVHRWDAAAGLASMQFVGIDNYRFTLQDPWYWKSLWNTFCIALLSGLPQHLVAMPLAFFIHTRIRRWRNLVVGTYFLPYITSSVAIALIFVALFSTDFGLINQTLAWLHRVPVLGLLFPDHPIDWINEAAYIKPAVSLVVFWRYVGWNTVLYLAALQTIPKELFEAATIDGASRWQQFRFVALPLLRPMMYFAVTLSIIGGLQLFEEPFILTPEGKGGSDQAAMTTAMYLYRTAFDFGEFGTAAAMSWLLFLTIGALTWLNNLVFAKSGLKDAE